MSEHQKKVELELDESDLLLRLQKCETILETLHEGIVVASGGRVRYANRRFFEMFPFTAQDLASTSIYDVVHPEDRKRILTLRGQAVAGRLEKFKFQYRITDPCGETRWLENSTVTIDWEGKPAWVNFISDITDRKKTEEDLIRSEEIARTLLDAMDGEALLADADGTVLAANEKTRVFFKEAGKEIVGQKAWDHLPGTVAKARKSRMKKALTRKNPIFFEETWEKRIFKVTLAPIRTHEGAAERLAVFSRDITAEKRKAAGLASSQERLAEIIQRRTRELQETQTALKVLLSHRDQDKQELEENILTAVQDTVQPLIARLKKSNLNLEQKTYLATIESNLKKVTASFARNLTARAAGLTPSEVEVVELIRGGRSTREIGNLLGISSHTVNFHRKNLRAKLGLVGSGINLKTYLLSLPSESGDLG